MSLYPLKNHVLFNKASIEKDVMTIEKKTFPSKLKHDGLN